MKIGVFDSGVGGITVLNELKCRFPWHEYLYFGDTANVPYGTKSEAQIQNLVQSASLRMKEKNIEALVIACNTASSIAYQSFKKILGSIHLVDVVEAGVKAVLDQNDESAPQAILILGTRATIKSKIYSRLLSEKAKNLVIYEQECSLLVPMIEEGWHDHPILKATVMEYLKPYLKLTPGIALLACTHYPWIKGVFEACLPGWVVLDSAAAVASIATPLLSVHGQIDAHAHREITWYFSDTSAVTSKVFSTPPRFESF